MLKNKNKMSDNQMDKRMAWRILCALLKESSFGDDFDVFRNVIQRDLHLTNEQMDQLYNLTTLCRLLEPKEHSFKGVPLPQSVMRRSSFHSAFPSPRPASPADWSQPYDLSHFFPAQASGPTWLLSQQQETCAQRPCDETEHAETEQQTETENKHENTQETNNSDTESKTTEKNRDPIAKALRKILRGVNIPTADLEIDTVKYPSAVVVCGDTKPHKDALLTVGGKWNPRVGAWIFSKAKIAAAMSTAQQRQQEGEAN